MAPLEKCLLLILHKAGRTIVVCSLLLALLGGVGTMSY